MKRSLAVLALVVGAACSTPEPGAGPTATPSGPKLVRFDPDALARLGVKVEPAGSEAQSHTLELPGTIEYNLERYAEVGSLLDGRVADVAVRVGDPVKRGQRLATILVPEIVEAQAQYLSVRAAATTAREQVTRERDLAAQQLTTARELEVAEGGEQARRSRARGGDGAAARAGR